jgi:probable HAF family extracellular repeat protein
LDSWSYSEAHGMNGSGVVVGEYEPTNLFYVAAFEYSNGVMTDLGHLGGAPYAVAYGVNDTNLAVGESNEGVDTYGFLYTNGVMVNLGTIGGTYSSAHAINRSGQIVGESTVSLASGAVDAVLYSGGSKVDLGLLGGDYSSGTAINAQGVIVGESDVVSQGVTNVHAFLYTGGTMHDLGTLGGGYSSAKGINNSGVVVGEAEQLIGGASYLRGFVYSNGVMNSLPTLGGSTGSASAINSAGLIVGYATDSNEVANAFLYNGSRMINLTALIPPSAGWTNLASADAINDAGQIAGSGYRADGQYHAYLLTPTNPSITLASPVVLAGGQFQVTVQGMAGQQFALLASSNLVNWVSLLTNTLSSTSMNVADPNPVGVQQFYRAQLLP